MRRYSRVSTVLRVVYWVVILGVAAGAYYFIQPYVQSMFGAYNQITGGNSTGSSQDKASSSYFQSLQELLK
ncbi:MAG: hypothetical protein A3B11_00790 [Candidatus Taylorbacteria bacterium RIFCSPLOWO2_01_FULL_44_26]|uniref:Uncharacterized protein n=1 Tax=Candidatus Taylorbacteria bacterium RIFCSPLOWO2_01_FULL_44_26 TaxID=1802318 RepID=A0A1G2N859_9BACT|nr:MAG: hypothetical protein A3B11_00790 [Candidatus Taylorbacteria bacterium RIFCSPLOWO2_01_FULL_44_26]